MTETLRRKVVFYQRMMMDAKTCGDAQAHEFYKKLSRQLTEEIRQKEKTDCSQQSAQKQNTLLYFSGSEVQYATH